MRVTGMMQDGWWTGLGPVHQQQTSNPGEIWKRLLHLIRSHFDLGSFSFVRKNWIYTSMVYCQVLPFVRLESRNLWTDSNSAWNTRADPEMSVTDLDWFNNWMTKETTRKAATAHSYLRRLHESVLCGRLRWGFSYLWREKNRVLRRNYIFNNSFALFNVSALHKLISLTCVGHMWIILWCYRNYETFCNIFHLMHYKNFIRCRVSL